MALGAALMVAGHFMMASESLFLFALLLLIVGNGAFKPNIVTQLGGLYPHGDTRRDRAYSIFYVGINIGAFFSPLVAGTLGETVGWHYGFASAGVGMAVGLAIYAFGLPQSPARTPAARAARAMRKRARAARCSASPCCFSRRRCSGAPMSNRATPSRYGRRVSPTAASICCSGKAKFPSPGSRRSIR